MDRILSKSLDRIRKFSDKGQIDKALQLLDDQIQLHPNHLFLHQEEIRISLLHSNWSELLRRMKGSLSKFAFADLLKNESRLKFMDLFRDTPAFRTALMDHLLNSQAFDMVADLIQSSESGDQNWMASHWIQLSQEIQDERLASNWQIAAGIANFFKGDWDMAWSLWTLALRTEPRALKKIMNICQQSEQMEMSQLNHRLKIIRLIHAAGRREEAISLLHALGMERKENALQVLIEIPHLLSEELDSLEVSRLRFNLAIFLQDGEIISSVVKNMAQFDDDDLFAFQKQAAINLEDKDFKRNVLLQIAQVYIIKGSWESAASLLEGLHEEDEHPEIIAKMEEVLENYPILPKMHFLVAKYQVQNRVKDQALKHLSLIKEVGEYHDPIQKIILDILTEDFDRDYAEFLIDLLPADSDLAALLSWATLHSDKDLGKEDIENIISRIPKKRTSPFWLLTLAKANMQLLQPQNIVDAVSVFLQKFPDLSPEILKFAEMLIDLPGVDLDQLSKIITESAEKLIPRDLWILLPRQIEFRVTTASDRTAASKRELVPVETKDAKKTGDSLPPVTDMSSTFSRELDEILAFADSGEHRAASQLAERLAEQHPDKVSLVLAQLDDLSEKHGNPLVWEKSRMHVFVRSEAYDQAIELGKRLLEQRPGEKDLPPIHQLMAFAHDGAGHHAQALDHLCESSRDSRYYQRNRRQFYRLLFPDNIEQLPKVLDLVIANGDASTWSTLMNAWHREAPESAEEQLKWHVRFSDRIKQSSAYLDLAYRAAQANRVPEAHAALSKIDFKEPDLADRLIRVVDLIKLKVPQDVSAPFTLGRYYLIQEDVSKAVDIFRVLAQEIPDTSQKIYSYLHKYMEIHQESQSNIPLCGLMIRIALELGLLIDAVKILTRLSRKDTDGAKSLSGGVYRVISQKRNNREAIFAYLQLLNSWEDHETLLDVLASSDLGRQMTDQRFEWLDQAAQFPNLADRANLAKARLFFEIQEFNQCYETLKNTGDEIKGNALPLYQDLVKRLPTEIRLHREAGWVFWRCGRNQDASDHLHKVIEEGTGKYVLESYALLRELGENIDFGEILEKSKLPEDQALEELHRFYEKVRRTELTRWQEEGGIVPLESLSWLLHTGQFEIFDTRYAKMKSFIPAEKKAILEARRKCSQGQAYYAAIHLLESPSPVAIKRSFLATAGLLEQAILLKDPDQEAIPYWLKQQFLNAYGKPRMILAQYALLKDMALARANEATQTETQR